MVINKIVVFMLLSFLRVIAGAEVCGKRNVDPSMVTGGQDAVEGEFPWHAAVYRLIEERYEYICGGTLIRTDIIITATSCVYNQDTGRNHNATLFKVALGKRYREYNGDPENSGAQIVDVDHIRIPLTYNGYPYGDQINIALLKLASPVIITSKVNVACVELNVISDKRVFSNRTKGTVAGWDVNVAHTDGPTTLQWQDMPWINKEKCLVEASPVFKEYLKEDKFCAGYVNETKSACARVEGAGYMVMKRGHYYLRGVALAGPNYNDTTLCLSVRYTTFASFAHRSAWVKSVIGSKKYLNAGGKTTGDIHGSIFGGVAVEISNYPYQLSLQYDGGHQCGASIISAYWALTAAHCVVGEDAQPMLIRSGSSYHGTGGTMHNVIMREPHLDFNSETYDYDICLLKVRQQFQYGNGVRAIQLPEQGKVTRVGEEASISGWGEMNDKGEYPDQLQAAVVPVRSERTCKSMHRQYPITSQMICAGFTAGGIDACLGDSGGPMVVDGVLVGIVSWGEGCALPNSPGVYEKVSEFRTWIDQKIHSQTHT